MRLKDHEPFFLVKITALLGCLVCFVFPPATRAEPKLDLSEKDITAAVLSKIPPYITWPAHKQTAESDKLILGIFGEDPELEALLQGLLQAQPAGTRPFIVKSVKAAEEVAQCHILFIPRKENDRWRELLSQDINVSGLLTVGESDNFVKLGYVFNLNFPAKRKLEISLKNARTARLLVKPELLQLANIIR